MIKIILIILVMFMGGFINAFLIDIGHNCAIHIGFVTGMITYYILQY